MSDKNDFGSLVKFLRLLRQGINEQSQLRQWSQKTLAKKSNLSVSTLKKIEAGEHDRPELYVEPLAKALQLTEYQKHHFYAVAGLIYPGTQSQVTGTEVINILKQVDCPAYARTALWDFVAFNDYHRLLWEYTDETLLRLKDTTNGNIGPNLLRVLFEDEFQSGLRVKRLDDRAKRAIKVFRGESFRYITSNRYKEIMRYFEDNKKFQQAWRMSEEDDDVELDMSLSRTFVKIQHPTYGRLEFLSVRIPERYIGDYVTVSVYHPVIANSENWTGFTQDAKPNFVHRFVDEPDKPVQLRK